MLWHTPKKPSPPPTPRCWFILVVLSGLGTRADQGPLRAWHPPPRQRLSPVHRNGEASVFFLAVISEEPTCRCGSLITVRAAGGQQRRGSSAWRRPLPSGSRDPCPGRSRNPG